MHEIISNTKWDTHWMHEFLAVEIPESPDASGDSKGDTWFVPVGPYRNPLSLSFDDKKYDILDNYRHVINLLESGGPKETHSHTHIYINNEMVREYINAWAKNPLNTFVRPATVSNPGIEQPYHIGRWFNDMIGDRTFLGGGNRTKLHKRTRTKTRTKGGRFFNTMKRNSRSFLLNKAHLTKNIPTSSMNNKKQTSTRKNNQNRESKGKEKVFVPMNRDTYDSLIRVFENKKYRIILDTLHTRSSSDK
jgi:hypothetical protein